jgi:protein phosphatase
MSHISHVAVRIINNVVQSRMPNTRTLFSIPTQDLENLCSTMEQILSDEPPVWDLSGQICVVGDIHGNIDVLLRIFERHGYPPRMHYLFLGDYVDRGRHSLEVISLLFSLKVLYPTYLFLLRGNHEFADLTAAYGFKKECEDRGFSSSYPKILKVFRSLPVAAVIGPSFCVHGGLSPQLQSWSDIATLTKLDSRSSADDFEELAILWSDPKDSVTSFAASPRGCGFLYGPEAVSRFTQDGGPNNRIIRAHESCANGFDFPLGENGGVITVFSSCDYCAMGNAAAVVIVDDEDREIPEFSTFSPIGKHDQQNRRVQYPDWLLEPEMITPQINYLEEIPMMIEI